MTEIQRITVTKACLSPVAIQHAENARNIFRVTVPESFTPDDMEKRDTWNLLAGRFLIGDKIEAYGETGEWYCEYLVINTDRLKPEQKGTYAEVRALFPVVMLAVAEDDHKLPEGFNAVWKGPALRWVVVRLSDSERIKDKLDSKAQAVKWVCDFVKAAA